MPLEERFCRPCPIACAGFSSGFHRGFARRMLNATRGPSCARESAEFFRGQTQKNLQKLVKVSVRSLRTPISHP